MTEVQLSHDNSTNNNNMWSVTGYCDLIANGHLMLGFFIINQKLQNMNKLSLLTIISATYSLAKRKCFWGLYFQHKIEFKSMSKDFLFSYLSSLLECGLSPEFANHRRPKPLSFSSVTSPDPLASGDAARIINGQEARPGAWPWQVGIKRHTYIFSGYWLRMWLNVYGRKRYSDLLSSRHVWTIFGEFSQIYVTPEPVMINDMISPTDDLPVVALQLPDTLFWVYNKQ